MADSASWRTSPKAAVRAELQPSPNDRSGRKADDGFANHDGLLWVGPDTQKLAMVSAFSLKSR